MILGVLLLAALMLCLGILVWDYLGKVYKGR